MVTAKLTAMVDSLTGRTVVLALVDEATGEIVPPSRTRLMPGPGADDQILHMLEQSQGAEP